MLCASVDFGSENYFRMLIHGFIIAEKLRPNMI